MNSRLKSCSLTVVIFFLASMTPALAHHSFAMFDQTKVMTLDGLVTKFQWTNPHGWIEIDVKSGNQAVHWSLELNSPNNLSRQGWSRSALKAGDKIKVSFYPLRDGKQGGLFLDLEFPDGRKLADKAIPRGRPVNVPVP